MNIIDLPINLQSSHGYFGFYLGVRSGVSSGYDAYLITEKIAEQIHGVKIFDDYNKFLSARKYYCMTLRKHPVVLTTRKGFYVEFYKIRPKFGNDKEAYEALEVITEEQTGRRMFGGYKSFITNRGRDHKYKPKNWGRYNRIWHDLNDVRSTVSIAKEEIEKVTLSPIVEE